MRMLGHDEIGSVDNVPTSLSAGTATTKQEAKPIVSVVSEQPLERLRCWPENPRTIRPERLEQLKRALAADPEMLQARPLLALPDGTVIAGSQRLRAARELGWQTIPVITVELERERARLWALRDNNPYGEWEEQALAELLAELGEGGVELALAGLAERQVERLLAGMQPAADPDDAPPLPARGPQP